VKELSRQLHVPDCGMSCPTMSLPTSANSRRAWPGATVVRVHSPGIAARWREPLILVAPGHARRTYA